MSTKHREGALKWRKKVCASSVGRDTPGCGNIGEIFEEKRTVEEKIGL